MQSEISEKLSTMFNVDTLECISVFGFRTQVCFRQQSSTAHHDTSIDTACS